MAPRGWKRVLLICLVAVVSVSDFSRARAEDAARYCRSHRTEELVMTCLEAAAARYAVSGTNQQPEVDISIAELVGQVRRAFQYAPNATCELKIYTRGAVIVCQ